MKKGASRALLKLLSKKTGKARRKAAEKKFSVLSSPARKAMFEFLCAHPCAGASRVARGAGVSIPTAQWHLAKMARAGYIISRKEKSLVFFYAPNLLFDDDAGMFMFFSKRERAAVYIGICRLEGSTAGELASAMKIPQAAARAAIAGLSRLGLVSEIRDGRSKRYYPTALLEERSRQARKNWKAMQNWLVRKLAEERLSPKVVRSAPGETVIELRAGARVVEVKMVTDPYSADMLERSITQQ